ncbi:MAG: hypothetical protein V1493_04500 [Candidatus Diapherotrites archaeon]
MARLHANQARRATPSGEPSLDLAFGSSDIPPDSRSEIVKELLAGFLSRAWHEEAKARNGRTKLPIPSLRERLYGGKLPKADLKEIEKQMNFAINVFTNGLPQKKKDSVNWRVKSLITGKTLSISAVLEENGKDIKELWDEAMELYHYIKRKGEIYPALMQDATGKIYFTKGWRKDKHSKSSPIHETVHVLQKLGVIKVDVPFAQAADRLYCLERKFLKPSKKLKTSTARDLNRKAVWNKKDKTHVEAYWSKTVGDKIGQWVFVNIPKKQRWSYLYQRCMGKSHRAALKRIGFEETASGN